MINGLIRISIHFYTDFVWILVAFSVLQRNLGLLLMLLFRIFLNITHLFLTSNERFRSLMLYLIFVNFDFKLIGAHPRFCHQFQIFYLVVLTASFFDIFKL